MPAILSHFAAAYEDAQNPFSEWYRNMDFEARKRKVVLRPLKKKLKMVTAKKDFLTRRTRTGWTEIYRRNFSAGIGKTDYVTSVSMRNSLAAKNRKLKKITAQLQGQLKDAMAEKAILEQQQAKITTSCIMVGVHT